MTFPDTLKPGALSESWKVKLAESYSSPIEADGRIFTLETRDKKQEIARAFDLQTGEQIWEVSWTCSIKVPFFAAKNGSWVRATPTVANGAVTFVGCATSW